MHAVEGSLKAAKLPRVGSRLNASKPESELESGDAQYAEGGVQPEASASMTIVWGSSWAASSRGPGSASSNSPPAVSQSFGDDKHLVGRHVRVREVLVPRVTECCFTTQIAPLDPPHPSSPAGGGVQPLIGGQDQYPLLLFRAGRNQPERGSGEPCRRCSSPGLSRQPPLSDSSSPPTALRPAPDPVLVRRLQDSDEARRREGTEMHDMGQAKQERTVGGGGGGNATARHTTQSPKQAKHKRGSEAVD